MIPFVFFPEWAQLSMQKLPIIPKNVEIYLQESSLESQTGKLDALSFAIEELGLKVVLQKHPFIESIIILL